MRVCVRCAFVCERLHVRQHQETVVSIDARIATEQVCTCAFVAVSCCVLVFF